MASFDEKNAEKEEKEKKKEHRIESLKARLAHLTRKDYYVGHLDISPENLARWLDASDSSVVFAEARLRASIEHARKVSKTASASTFAPSHVLRRYLGGGMCGVDRQGSLVYFLLFGVTDMLGMVESSSREQFMVHWACHMYKMIDQLKNQDYSKKNAHNILLIVDLDGCTANTFSWAALTGWAQAAQIYEDLHLGLFKEILLINPPNVLPVIYKVLTTFLKPNTRRKVKVIGAANTLRHLLIRMEKHEIPAYLGGYKCDPNNNPYCLRNIRWPEKVPRWRYHTNPTMPANVFDAVVYAGSVFKRDIVISVPDASISWFFFNVSHPIILKFTPPTPPPSADRCRDPLVKPRPLYTTRLDSLRCQQAGHVPCPVAGVYNLVLDNSKNMTHTVKAKFKVTVLTQERHLRRYMEQIPLGDTVNFFEPVTQKERLQRQKFTRSS